MYLQPFCINPCNPCANFEPLSNSFGYIDMISMPWFPGAGVLAKLLSTNSIAKPNGDGKAGGVRAFGWVEFEISTHTIVLWWER